MISISRPYKYVVGCIELFLGFPIIGGAFILSLAWLPLMVMLFVHFIGYYLARDERKNVEGHLLGIMTALIGAIPFIGMILHLVTGFILLQEVYERD